MSKMNQTQRNYAIEQLNGIRADRVRDFTQAHTVPGARLSQKEKVKALRKGEFKILPEADVGYSTYNEHHSFALADVVTFPGERKAVVNKKAVDAFTAKETKRYRGVVNEIMLGDSDVALKLIEAYSQPATPKTKPTTKGSK